MPVHVDSSHSSLDRDANTQWLRDKEPPADPRLRIGLVNNMAAAAFPATERQFVTLLESASNGIPVELSLYSLPGIPRHDLNGRPAGGRYASVEKLWKTRLDGLIVTGREPLTSDLRDESYWGSFTQLLEWARTNTHSTVWSCLAAHAAVLHMDGIERRKSANKHFGLFECERVSDHRLTTGTPQHFHVPHSRWNGLPEEQLSGSGYTVLARTIGSGVDTFVKQDDSLFVFYQGHPEYESDTLLREYRRDVGRYLRGEVDTYPLLPRSYFDQSTEAALNLLREQAISSRGEKFVAHVASALESIKIQNVWGHTASHHYRNWLQYISARKAANRDETNANVECSASS